MRKSLVLCASLAFLSAMAYAESWSGTLVDATCAMQNQQSQQSQPNQQSQPYEQNQNQESQPGQQGSTGSGYSGAACEPTSTTTSFALRTSSGQTYQLDDAGNAKVITAMRDRADRMNDQGTTTSSQTKAPVHATVKGTLSNNIIKVDSVQMQ